MYHTEQVVQRKCVSQVRGSHLGLVAVNSDRDCGGPP
jgi:hypothetical protein